MLLLLILFSFFAAPTVADAIKIGVVPFVDADVVADDVVADVIVALLGISAVPVAADVEMR